ncbi:hypothetical protein BH10PSE13_BH10PSE13_02020 [soil metagenome]
MNYQRFEGPGPLFGLMFALPLSLAIWSILGLVAAVIA